MFPYERYGNRIPSEREHRVIEFVAQGLKNRDVAHAIGTTEHVVKNYLRVIYDKLGLWNRVEFALWYESRRQMPDAPGWPRTSGIFRLRVSIWQPKPADYVIVPPQRSRPFGPPRPTEGALIAILSYSVSPKIQIRQQQVAVKFCLATAFHNHVRPPAVSRSPWAGHSEYFSAAANSSEPPCSRR